MSGNTFRVYRSSKLTPHCSNTADTVRLIVGPEQREFLLPKQLLSDCSPFFSDMLAPAGNPLGLILPNDSRDNSLLPAPLRHRSTLWLPAESADAFEFFAIWLQCRRTFRRAVDEAIASGGCSGHCSVTETAAATAPSKTTTWLDDTPSRLRNSRAAGGQRRRLTSSELHWALVRLHLFAFQLGLPELQDEALDGLQDLYLARNWDASPGLVTFLYDGRCDADAAFRLRRWVVAMVAWTLALSRRGLDNGVAVEGGLHGESPGFVPAAAATAESRIGQRDSPLDDAFATTGRVTAPAESPLQSAATAHNTFQRLLDAYPAFEGDYRRHVRKMTMYSQSAASPIASSSDHKKAKSRQHPAVGGHSHNRHASDGDYSGEQDRHQFLAGDDTVLATKNPTLRLASNSLRNGERSVGFRLCAFHSHRGVVGQGKCPNRIVVRPPWKQSQPQGQRREQRADAIFGFEDEGLGLMEDVDVVPVPVQRPQDENLILLAPTRYGDENRCEGEDDDDEGEPDPFVEVGVAVAKPIHHLYRRHGISVRAHGRSQSHF